MTEQRKRFFADITPLRASREFRLLWSGEVITVTGSQVTAIALIIQVYAVTGSPAAVGLLGLVEFLPLVVGTAIAGPLIDRYDRRDILRLTQLLLAATSGILLYTALADDPQLWLIYATAGLASFLAGIDVPARQATTPALVDKRLLQSALSLNIVMWNVSIIAGPFIGGGLVRAGGLAWAYAFDLTTFVVAILLVTMMKRIPPSEGAGDKSGWESFKEGIRYLKGRRVIQSTFFIDMFAMVFGLPEALFPILAVTKYTGDASATFYLFFAIAVGALVASVTNGWTHRIKHQGQAVVWMVVLWGIAIVFFGFSSSLWAALLFLTIAGGADALSAVFRGTILQSSLTDEMRGRITSIHFLVVSGGPRLGNLESGLVAQWTSPLLAIVSGGVVCILGAFGIAAFVPEFWHYHAGEDT